MNILCVAVWASSNSRDMSLLLSHWKSIRHLQRVWEVRLCMICCDESMMMSNDECNRKLCGSVRRRVRWLIEKRFRTKSEINLFPYKTIKANVARHRTQLKLILMRNLFFFSDALSHSILLTSQSKKRDLILIHFISSVIELRFEMMFAFFSLCTRSQESNFKMRLSDNSPCFQSSLADDVVNSFRYNNKNKSRRCWFSSPPHRRDRRPAPMSARFVAKVPKGSKDEWRESLSEGKMQNNGREAT